MSRLYGIYLSIKDLENLAEFNLFQNLHLSTQTSNLLEKLVLFFLYNFHAKIKNKKSYRQKSMWKT